MKIKEVYTIDAVGKISDPTFKQIVLRATINNKPQLIRLSVNYHDYQRVEKESQIPELFEELLRRLK